MVISIDVPIDVTEAASLGEAAWVQTRVTLPDSAPSPGLAVLCFAQHGGGYNRFYWDFDLPGGDIGGGEATFHADRGWVFAAIDHLGCGASSHHDSRRLDYTTVTRAYHAAVSELRSRLESGTLADGFAPLANVTTLGIGQSRGGSTTVVQQARHNSFDGVGVLGFSAIHTRPKPRPGQPPLAIPFVPRDASPSEPFIVNSKLIAKQQAEISSVSADVAGAGVGAIGAAAYGDDPHPLAWCFHYDDEDLGVVRRDMSDFPSRHGELPLWATAETIGLTQWVLTPGAIAAEAAALVDPVLVVMGERDVSDDPMSEPKAYRSANDVQVFVCPRMGHMHNFATTRQLLWHRTHSWGDWVAAQRSFSAPTRPTVGADRPDTGG